MLRVASNFYFSVCFLPYLPVIVIANAVIHAQQVGGSPASVLCVHLLNRRAVARVMPPVVHVIGRIHHSDQQYKREKKR